MIEYTKDDIKREIDTQISVDWPTADSLGVINGMKEYLADHIVSSKNTIAKLARSFDLASASGARLDEIGYLLGTPRIQYNSSGIIENNIKITTTDGGTFGSHYLTDKVLYSGIRIYNSDKDIGVFSTVDKILPTDSTEVYLTVALESTNLSGYIPAGYLDQVDYTTASRNIVFDTSKLRITNTSPIEALPDFENDDQYRYRLDLRRQSWKTDNISRVLNIIERMPISQYSIVRNKHSFGTVIALVVPNVVGSNPALIPALEQAATEEFPMVNGFIKFQEPRYIYVDLGVSVSYVPNSTQPQTSVLTNGISDYINNLEIGETLDLEELKNHITGLHSSISSANINTLLLNGMAVDLTVYNTIKAEWYEKFISVDRVYQEGSTTVQRIAVQIS